MKKKRLGNNGFTLVELIVVIVILGILAAILVPALLGYIDKAKEKQDMLDAKNMLTATQARMVEAYANDEKIYISTSGDVDWVYNENKADTKEYYPQKIISDILQVAELDPYLCIIGMGDGSRTDELKASKKEEYTVYFVAYWSTKDSSPIFFDGENWGLDYPWVKKGNNVFTVKGVNRGLRFYFITNKVNKTNISDAWNKLKKAVEVGGHTVKTGA